MSDPVPDTVEHEETVKDVQPPGNIVKIEEHHDEEEVIERLFAVPKAEEITKEVAGLWSWVSKGSQSLVDQASKLSEQANQKAEELKLAAEKVAEKVIVSAEESRQDFDKEQERFMVEATDPEELAEANKVPDTRVNLPWEPENEHSETIKAQILKLSQEENTFLVPPPKEVDFTFDFESNAPAALAMLEADPNLSTKRFYLVPKKIKETAFWRNFFYRVNLIKESYGQSPYLSSKASEYPEHGHDDDEEEQHAKGHEVFQHQVEVDEIDAQDVTGEGLVGEDRGDAEDPNWEIEFRNEVEFDDENFDMLDDNDELLNVSDIDDDDDDEDVLDLEAKIKAELNL